LSSIQDPGSAQYLILKESRIWVQICLLDFTGIATFKAEKQDSRFLKASADG